MLFYWSCGLYFWKVLSMFLKGVFGPSKTGKISFYIASIWKFLILISMSFKVFSRKPLLV